MKLHQHEDFATLISVAASEENLPEALVEGDYWTTEILGAISQSAGERAVLEGATSLAGFSGLPHRPCGAIGLLLEAELRPALSGPRTVSRALRGLHRELGYLDGLERIDDFSQSIDSLARSDVFRYQPIDEFPATVLLRTEVQSEVHPTDEGRISCYVGRRLRYRDVDEMGIEGVEPFTMRVAP